MLVCLSPKAQNQALRPLIKASDLGPVATLPHDLPSASPPSSPTRFNTTLSSFSPGDPEGPLQVKALGGGLGHGGHRGACLSPHPSPCCEDVFPLPTASPILGTAASRPGRLSLRCSLCAPPRGLTHGFVLGSVGLVSQEQEPLGAGYWESACKINRAAEPVTTEDTAETKKRKNQNKQSTPHSHPGPPVEQPSSPAGGGGRGGQACLGGYLYKELGSSPGRVRRVVKFEGTF